MGTSAINSNVVAQDRKVAASSGDANADFLDGKVDDSTIEVTGDTLTLKDKAVSIAKIADGTDGELVTWDAAGVADTVDVGTADQVLTSNGTGLAPTFQDAGGGGGAGNVIFSWSGVTEQGDATHGLIIIDTLTFDVGLGANPQFMFLVSDANIYRTLLTFQFTKIASISTITIHGRLWAETTAANAESFLRVDIGGQNNFVKSVTSVTPTWVTTSDIDVSGLSDGTTYDGECDLKGEVSGFSGYCSAVTLIAS